MREMIDFILWIGAAFGILNMIAYSMADRLERQRKAEELRREVEARRRRNGSMAAINFDYLKRCEAVRILKGNGYKELARLEKTAKKIGGAK